MRNWDFKQSKILYNITDWGEGYFNINEKGNIAISPSQTDTSIDLYDLAIDLQSKGFSLPTLVRFPDVLHHRVSSLNNAFDIAMTQENYAANYTPVYPIKVNQQYHVVNTILTSGQAGLEAGSKAELIAVLAMSPKQGIIVCNGYKDREYIRLALIGQEMGLCLYLVIEKFSEIALILEEAQKLNIKPQLGIRIKLASVAKGKWQDSGGAKSKFGLSSAQVIDLANLLKKEGFIDCLRLMHFHIGSQIPNINDIQKGLSEAGRYYAELRALGAPIDTVDAGGGLGIDYEGIRSRRPCSKNYSLQEYANNIVYEFNTICNTLGLPKPNLITETGRAITAHHTVLITNVIDDELITHPLETDTQATPEAPNIIKDLSRQLHNINQCSALEAYHNAVSWLSEVHSLFSHGAITLKQRAQAEKLYYTICLKTHDLLQATPHNHAYREVLDELNEKLVDKYFINLSLFKSAPDAWAIQQLFPIVPLHRLNEYPSRRATLQDLTCDSDGQFKHYVSSEGTDTSLPVHSLTANEPYLLGIFLTGAYQEILGDMHNLFGNTDSVNIQIKTEGGYELTSSKKGDTIKDMLNYVSFDTHKLLDNYHIHLENTALSSSLKQAYYQELAHGLENYTYLNV